MLTSASSKYDTRARPKPHTFYPPQPNSLLIGLVQRGIRGTLRRKLKVTDVDISSDDLATLRRLQGKRSLVTPSHSGGFEPHILMYLSKLLGDYFYYVAALEVFEQSPVNRWVMPRLGVYSILRGAVDRPSFSMTRQLLAEGKRWMVIFPEGEAIWQNSTLVPFQQGVFQLAFKAYEDARETDDTASLHCVPMAIKYVYTQDMHGEMDASLARLEAALSLAAEDRPANRHARLRRISEAVVVANEKSHGVKPAPDHTMDDRIQGIKTLVISKIEQQLGITPNDRQSMLDRIRALFNAVDRIVYDEPATSPYEQQLAAERARMAKTLYDDLWRLLQFVAVYDGYVSESITIERFMDVLCLLEMEVLRKRRIWGPRHALVKVGTPVDLRDHYAAYCNDKRETVQNITMELELAVRQMLNSLGANRPTVREG